MRRSRRSLRLVAALTLAGLLAPQAGAEPDAGAAKKVVLQGLRLQDLDGATVDLGSYLGRGPLLLDFWATWCKPCLAALPHLNQLYADLQPRGLQMVGVNEDGQRGAAKVKPFVQTKGVRFPVLLDLNQEAQSRLGVLVLPTTILLDADGRVVHTTLGYRAGETETLRAKIEALLPPEAHE
jgi:thiol-disulfide isomerase/thioredoxin